MVCPSIYWTVCWSSTRNPIPNNKFGKSLKQDARKRMWKWRKVLCNYWLQLEWKQLCVMLSSWSQLAHCWQQKEKQVRLTNLMLLEPIPCSWMWRDRAITWRTIRANIYSAKKPKPTQAQEWMKKNDVNEIKYFYYLLIICQNIILCTLSPADGLSHLASFTGLNLRSSHNF